MSTISNDKNVNQIVTISNVWYTPQKNDFSYFLRLVKFPLQPPSGSESV